MDVVILTENEVSKLFGFTTSYFHVDLDVVGSAVRFLRELMPKKPLEEIYTVLGRAKRTSHGTVAPVFRPRLGGFRPIGNLGQGVFRIAIELAVLPVGRRLPEHGRLEPMVDQPLADPVHGRKADLGELRYPLVRPAGALSGLVRLQQHPGTPPGRPRA